MEQNKSVEEVVEEVTKLVNNRIYTENGGINSIHRIKTIEREEWIKAIQQERQTSQEREREIVEAMLKIQYGKPASTNPHYNTGFNNAVAAIFTELRAVAKTYLTNPKD